MRIDVRELKNMDNQQPIIILCHMCKKDRQVQIEENENNQGIDFEFDNSVVWFCFEPCRDNWLDIYGDKISLPGEIPGDENLV